MYKEAYNLIIEILKDEQFNDYIKKNTGKTLAIIDAGANLTTPSASITFEGGEILRAENVMQDVVYNISFALPFWSVDSMKKCHDFLDEAIDTFFAHEQRVLSTRKNFVTKISPSIVEEDTEKKLWTVNLRVTVTIFY